MSRGDVEEFIKLLQTLRYPQEISIDSFDVPNFQLVADILYWMVQRFDYDPNDFARNSENTKQRSSTHIHSSNDDRSATSSITTHIHSCIDLEQDRIQFIKDVVIVLYTRSDITIDAKNLYAADGRAVGEMAKIARRLVQALTAASEYKKSGSRTFPSIDDEKKQLNQASYMEDIKTLRKMAIKITESGARLHTLLNAEMRGEGDDDDANRDESGTGFGGMKEVREKAFAFLQEVCENRTFYEDEKSSEEESGFKQMERILVHQLEEKSQQLSALEKELKLAGSEKKQTLANVKKKRVDLDRNERRLESLQSARPAFMDEFEKHEIELHTHFESYMERYRNVHYLRSELMKIQREEESKMNDTRQRMQKLQSERLEEELLMRGGKGARQTGSIAMNPRDGSKKRSNGGTDDDGRDNKSIASASLLSTGPSDTEEIFLEDDISVDKSTSSCSSSFSNNECSSKRSTSSYFGSNAEDSDDSDSNF